jgi:hypothetical protein
MAASIPVLRVLISDATATLLNTSKAKSTTSSYGRLNSKSKRLSQVQGLSMGTETAISSNSRSRLNIAKGLFWRVSDEKVELDESYSTHRHTPSLGQITRLDEVVVEFTTPSGEDLSRSTSSVSGHK